MKNRFLIVICLWLVVNTISAQKTLTILHTNDTHSRIEALPDNDRYDPGKGGVVNRKFALDSLRRVHKNFIVLDAGDFVQGTPYYNLFKGRAEVETMNLLGYDATTLGNHEFDYGLDSLSMIIKMLDIPVVNANYDFTGTSMEGLTVPYLILKRGGVKIGIVGVGIQPEGLIQRDKYEGMKFLPIVDTVNEYADFLRNKKKCDIVICLSHIGFNQDQELAQKTKDIDIIIGGHSHTFMDGIDKQKNLLGEDVLIYQAGARGANVGELVLSLSKGKKGKK